MAEKSYTSIEQSKTLAEILPIESADMIYPSDFDFPFVWIEKPKKDKNATPCWSLAALFSILAEQDFRINAIGNKFNIDIPIRHCKIWFSSLLDAAFEMVVWLKKMGKYEKL